MLGVAGNVRELLEGSMGKWRTELTAGGEVLGRVDMKGGIFQGDSLSTLLFVMVMIPLSMILKEYESNKGSNLAMRTGMLITFSLWRLYPAPHHPPSAPSSTSPYFSPTTL